MANTEGQPSQLSAVIAEAHRIEEDATYSAKGHFEAARGWNAWHYRVGVPTALAAASAGVSAISDQPALAAVLAFIVAATSAISTFLKPADRAAQHLAAGNAFKALQNDVRIFREVECQNPAIDLDETVSQLTTLNTRRNELNTQSPQIPKRAFELARQGIEAGEAAYATDNPPANRRRRS